MQFINIMIVLNEQMNISPRSSGKLKADSPQKKKNQNYYDMVLFSVLSYMKYKSEGMRMNILFVFLAEIFLIADTALGLGTMLLVYLAITTNLAFLVSIFAMKTFDIPKATGKFKVGYTLIQIPDQIKSVVAIFYPTDQTLQRDTSWAQSTSTSQLLASNSFYAEGHRNCFNFRMRVPFDSPIPLLLLTASPQAKLED